MSLIRISNLTFRYDNSYDNIFENISFQIDTHWKLGLIGRNGRGKTTLLKLLMGKYDYSGTIFPVVHCDYFPFDVPDNRQITIDVVSRVCSNYKLWELNRELSLLRVSEDVLYHPFKKLSNGEQTKVLLAAFFLKQNNFLLIDEPTNHLDLNARLIVSNYLRSCSKGFILVSHDRAFLDNCIDHIFSINKTNIEIQKGNFSSWQYNKRKKDIFEISKVRRLKKDIKRLSASARRTARWSKKVEDSKIGNTNGDKGYIGHKAAKMMKRSKSIETRRQKAIKEKSKLAKNIETTERLSMKPLKNFKNGLIEISGLSIFYDDRQICKNISFTVNQGDRIALNGKNGSGKTSIFKLLTAQKMVYYGEVRITGGLIISYVPQSTSFLKGTLRKFAQERYLDESLFKAVLDRLGVTKIQFEKDMSDFSDGQKKKVLLAQSLCQQAHLYIWDEPLNFVDILSRIQIEDLIIMHQPTMLFVEHDLSFVNTVATKQITL